MTGAVDCSQTCPRQYQEWSVKSQALHSQQYPFPQDGTVASMSMLRSMASQMRAATTYAPFVPNALHNKIEHEIELRLFLFLKLRAHAIVISDLSHVKAGEFHGMITLLITLFSLQYQAKIQECNAQDQCYTCWPGQSPPPSHQTCVQHFWQSTCRIESCLR